MESNNLYYEIYNPSNLILAWRKARKHKTKKYDVIDFEKELMQNLLQLYEELKNQTYKPLPLKTLVITLFQHQKSLNNS